jgi:DNA-binding beta-propeller fold protein YncE
MNRFGACIFLAWVCCSASGQEELIPPMRTLTGHKGGVTSVAYFPDGRRIVTGSRDGTARVWDVTTGESLRTIEGQKGTVYAVAVSADGARVATGAGDGVVRVWDVKSGELVAMLEGHTGTVRGVAYLPDGTILSGGRDGLRVWDVEKEKLVWKPERNGGAVWKLAVSKDGKRAAVANFENGVYEVWDLAGRKRLRTLGGWSDQRCAVGISPDGRELFAYDGFGGKTMTRWNVETGEKLPTVRIPQAESVVYSADGEFMATNGIASSGAVVYDARTWRRARVFSGPQMPLDEELLALAFSPDGTTLVAGSGFLLEKEGGSGAKANQVYVYDLSNLGGAKAAGAKAGKLSWEVVPLTLKAKAGEGGELDGADPRRPATAVSASFVRLADGLDAMRAITHVYFHRGGGAVDEVLNVPGAKFTDVVWDGRCAWVGSREAGVFVLDREGKTVAKIGRAEGLPACEGALKLYPIGAGRMLAAGVAGARTPLKGTGWIAVIERGDAAAAAVKVNVIFREAQLPAERLGRAQPNQSLMIPVWISEPPAAIDAQGKRVRTVWVALAGLEASGRPILRVDPETLGVTLYNVSEPAEWRAGGRDSPSGFSQYTPPVWLSDREAMYHVVAVERVTLGEKKTLSRERKLVLETAWPNEWCGNTPLLELGGQVYVPGKRWHRVDPKTLEVEDLGPGLRVNGVLVAEEVNYFVSGVWGLAAYDPRRRCVYRLSVDPARPLAVAATLDPAGAGKPVPDDGVVETKDGVVIFYCGKGGLRFSGGALRPGHGVEYPYRNPKEELDAELARAMFTQSRAIHPIGDIARLGLTAEQVTKLKELKFAFCAPDGAKLAGLFAAWEKAADAKARAEAARPIFAEARAAGEKDEELERAYFAALKEVLTPRQWKLANYQIPAEGDR